MNKFREIYQRVYMFCFYKFAGLLRWREPELLEGDKPLELIPFKIKELNLNKCLVVLDPVIEQLGLSTSLTNSLIKNDIEYVVFNKIEPNPKIRDIELGVKLYQESFCDSIIAFGGGSTMDTAKAIGARIARPNKSITQMGGLLKVGKNIPTLFAIPTTAGTGSETTIAAVVTDEVTHHKYAINDLHLIPKYAVLDPTLTVGLPKSITAFTGMDALTHAVEGYISKSVPKKYRLLAEEAIIKIFNNIIKVYDDGSNIEARKEMLEASYKAGVVFTRVGLTYVHPIAHTLGGLYNVPHGLANAVILPICLREYGKSVYDKLAHLADITNLTNNNMTKEEKVNAFIEKIEELNNYMGITRKFDIKEEDIETMIKWAEKEANGAYYPPVILYEKDIEKIIREIMN